LIDAQATRSRDAENRAGRGCLLEPRAKKTDLRPRHYYMEKNELLTRKMKTIEEIRCCPNSQAAKRKLKPLKNGTEKSPCGNRKTIGRTPKKTNQMEVLWRTKERKNEQHANVRHKLNFFIEIQARFTQNMEFHPLPFISLLKKKFSS
jgi:hypothetical protein